MIDFSFLEQGELLTPVNGKGVSTAEPRILDGSIPEDPEIVEALEEFREELKEYQVPIGNSTEDLRRQNRVESNMGNLVTDAARTCYWNDTLISFEINGDIRTDLFKGEITYEDVFAIMPWNNTIDKVTLKGYELLEIFEDSLKELSANDDSYYDDFFQVSGIRLSALVLDDNAGNRIQVFQTFCSADNETDYCDIDLEKEYTIALCSYLASRYTKRSSNNEIKVKEIGIPDHQCLKSYIEQKQTISPKVENRITIVYA